MFEQNYQRGIFMFIYLIISRDQKIRNDVAQSIV